MCHRFRSVTLSGLTIAAGLLLATPPPAAAQQMQMQTMAPGEAQTIRGLLPAVVNITAFVAHTSSAGATNATSNAATHDQDHPDTLRGSGFIIDPTGIILTNDHVVDGAYDIHVKFSDGVSVHGRILAATPLADLALVKVDMQHVLTVVRWADSEKVQIGDPVLAIGNPLGIGLSVSSGIVSGLNRNLMETPYDDFIQTDAAINHGNSGGPLFNLQGEVIGVDTAIISPTTGSVGLGFAIPSNRARYVAGWLLRDGHIRPAYFGVKIELVTPDMAIALGMPQPMGSIVAVVHEGGPAAAAGLQVGDVILRYDNQTPSDDRALLRDMGRSTVGQTVSMTVLRAGHELTLHATPIAWPEPETASNAASAPKPTVLVPPNLGLGLSMLNSELRAHYGLRMQQTGVLIDGVAADTDAFDRGLAPGDVILRMQDKDVTLPQEVQAAVDAARAQHKAFVLALVLQKKPQQNPGPRWMVLRVSAS
jgi:serine protease Do